MIEDTLKKFFDRCETVKLAGGLSMLEVVEGKPVPPGWYLDWQTDYYLPPNVILDN